jgi:hypothetical protein
LSVLKLQGGQCEVRVLRDELFVFVVEGDFNMDEFSVEDSGGENDFV